MPKSKYPSWAKKMRGAMKKKYGQKADAVFYATLNKRGMLKDGKPIKKGTAK